MNTGKRAIYPVEPWNITETEFKKENNYRNETAFSLSNGYIGTRGTFEEAYPFDIDTGLEGNFINGFYESEKIRYGEANFGSPLFSQSLLNVPNLKETRVCLDGEWFCMETGRTEDYARMLDMKGAELIRSLTFVSPKGKKARLVIRRLVSFEMKHIMAMRYEVTPLNFSGKITFLSRLQADVENHTRKTNPIVDYGPFGRHLDPLRMQGDEKNLYYEGIAKNSRLVMACGCSHRILGGFNGHERQNGERELQIRELDAELTLSACVEAGNPVALEKMICYVKASDIVQERPDSDSEGLENGIKNELESKLEGFVVSELKRAEKRTYGGLAESQRAYMEQFWETADIRIQGEDSDALQQGLRFNMFHTFQSAGRDGCTGMGAKGLSGEGYEGHYFWDTEMYALPVFAYTEPDVAKRLLDYRYGTLDAARRRARILGHEKGALFPWRTINGEEASTYYPLGTAQYHINADIAYALSLYLQATGDTEYLKEKGAEILIETARVWADVGSFASCKGGKYCICCVTGPDEYNVLSDNNFYTNLMARENLRDAVSAVEYLERHAPECLAGLEERLNFSTDELKLWEEIIEKMYFPYDEERKVYPLDDGFMMRKPWDESKIPEEKRAWLYENYHPLFIMRHRMSKQADAVLGMYLHSDCFSEEEIRRNYDFYQEVTLHHSSLSTCIFGIVACDIGYYDEAYTYFSQSARMDLDDYHNNLYAGIHAANMAGTWQAVVNGFAGLRCQKGILKFKPSIPEEWEGYSFKIRYKGALIKVAVSKEKAEFVLEKGGPAAFYVRGRKVFMKEKGERYIEDL